MTRVSEAAIQRVYKELNRRRPRQTKYDVQMVDEFSPEDIAKYKSQSPYNKTIYLIGFEDEETEEE